MKCDVQKNNAFVCVYGNAKIEHNRRYIYC